MGKWLLIETADQVEAVAVRLLSAKVMAAGSKPVFSAGTIKLLGCSEEQTIEMVDFSLVNL